MNRWRIVSILLVLLAAASSCYVYYFLFDRLPEQVPTHWDWEGKPDRWTPRQDLLFNFLLFPLMMAAVVALSLVLPWLSPRTFQVEDFKNTFEYILMLVNGLLLYLNVLILFASLNPEFELARWMVGGIFFFLMLIGNVLGKTRKNFWMGIRTPWTLASDRVWAGTHRLAAWLYVATGAAVILAMIVGVPVVWCTLAFIPLVYPVLHSLILYKRLERQGKLEPAASEPVA